jgi:hypothetical protein
VSDYQEWLEKKNNDMDEFENDKVTSTVMSQMNVVTGHNLVKWKKI